VGKAPEEVVKILIDMANQAGAEDNLAAIVITCDLAPGVSSFPRRPPSSPPRAKFKPKAPHPADLSAPEIVILGVETLDDERPQIHVVPAESSSPNLLGALGTFVGPLRPKTNPPASGKPAGAQAPIPTTPGVGDPAPATGKTSQRMKAVANAPTCAKCGKPIDNLGLVCPYCGTPREVKR
jgi:hypothetical protein